MIRKNSGLLTMAASTRAGLRAVLTAWLIFAVIGSASAEQIPALSEIESEIAAAHPELVKQREALINERKALLERTNSHNIPCSAVEAGSAAEASCNKSYVELSAAINSHVQASKQYNDKHLAVVNRAPRLKPVPHTDTSVVDARNIPSGLPKSVENAINGVYSSAPPGVSERVRKGFQAVMERDWKVAKAWFQDALNRDPNNANLQRLVALTDHTPPVKKPSSARRDSAPPSHTLKSLDADAGKMSAEETMKALENILAEKMREK